MMLPRDYLLVCLLLGLFRIPSIIASRKSRDLSALERMIRQRQRSQDINNAKTVREIEVRKGALTRRKEIPASREGFVQSIKRLEPSSWRRGYTAQDDIRFLNSLNRQLSSKTGSRAVQRSVNVQTPRMTLLHPSLSERLKIATTELPIKEKVSTTASEIEKMMDTEIMKIVEMPEEEQVERGSKRNHSTTLTEDGYRLDSFIISQPVKSPQKEKIKIPESERNDPLDNFWIVKARTTTMASVIPIETTPSGFIKNVAEDKNYEVPRERQKVFTGSEHEIRSPTDVTAMLRQDAGRILRRNPRKFLRVKNGGESLELNIWKPIKDDFPVPTIESQLNRSKFRRKLSSFKDSMPVNTKTNDLKEIQKNKSSWPLSSLRNKDISLPDEVAPVVSNHSIVDTVDPVISEMLPELESKLSSYPDTLGLFELPDYPQNSKVDTRSGHVKTTLSPPPSSIVVTNPNIRNYRLTTIPVTTYKPKGDRTIADQFKTRKVEFTRERPYALFSPNFRFPSVLDVIDHYRANFNKLWDSEPENEPENKLFYLSPRDFAPRKYLLGL